MPRATLPGTATGTVLAVGGGLAAVEAHDGARIAKLRRTLKLRPVVGDEVDITLLEDDDARIDRVHPRRSELMRMQRLGRGDQILVANADVLVVIAAAADPPLRRGLLDRLLVAAWAGRMDAAIVVTKADLSDRAEEPPAGVLADYAALGYPGVAVDARSDAGVAAVRELIGDRVAALVGHSGVGKSTLVSGLTATTQATGAVNEVIGRGRHTTTTARLLRRIDGVPIIDTPGIRGFALTGIDEADLAAAFPEIAQRETRCAFDDCLHNGEPGCTALEGLSAERLDSYRKLLDELRNGA